MSVRPIDSLSAASERLQLAIAAYAAVAERIIRMVEDEEAEPDTPDEMEAAE